MRPQKIHAAVVACLVVLAAAGCGSDEAADPTPDSAAEAESVTATDGPTAATDTTATETAPTPTSAEICDRLSIESVAADLGLDVTESEPSDASTPQCAYTYNDGSSNLTVAAMRPEDVGGATGDEAFDTVVAVNQRLAGDESEEVSVDAGTRASRISGSSLHLGIIQVDDQVYTLIVFSGDADEAAVERLMTTMGTALR